MNSPKRLSAQEITAMAAKATHRVMAAKSPAEIHVVSVIELSVADVKPYEHNPRKHANPKYDEIKESIKARGLESALYITKRPGSSQYILARGGKTRLLALQELAQENPAKWGKLNFHEVPWVSESEILAAHLVENTGREAMCFWDLAEGIADLKAQIAKETGKPVSARTLPDLLSARGVKVERAAIMAAEFALDYLGALGDWQPELCIEHIKDVIRPKFTALQSVWELNSLHDPESFKKVVHEAVERCVSEHDQYSPQSVVDSVIDAVAKGLDVSSAAIQRVLSVAQLVGTLEELQAIHAELQNGSQDHSQEQEPDHERSDPSGGPQDTHAAPTGPAPKPVLSDAVRKNINRLMGSGQQRATDVPGIPGVSVATGLTRREPKPPAGAASKAGGPLSQAELALLEGEGDQGLAKRVFWTELLALADMAGISNLVAESASVHLPYGYYMELPAPGRLGSSPDDIAVQAWWLLAAISEQGDPRRVPFLVGGQGPDGFAESAFKDTGSGCFQYAMVTPGALEDAVLHCLGGQEISGFDLLMLVLTQRRHPLHETGMQLLDACAHWNEARRET
jgi:ParB family protein of integrating conjugative element (PFGI_1 class)